MNRVFKVALSGFGTAGRLFHAPFITSTPGFELKAVYERTHSRAAELYPGVKTVRSFEELLDSGCDLAVICTPNFLHFEQAKAALEKGLNVLVDKPFCETPDQARELIELAASKKLVLTVYQNRRFDSEIVTLKEILSKGLIGRPVDLFLGIDRFPKGASPKHWKFSSFASAGILWDLGVHQIDQAYHLFGKPERVFCDLRTLRDFSAAPDRMDASLFYPDGLRVTVRSSLAAPKPGYSLVCHGTEGSYYKKGCDIQEAQLNAGLRPSDPAWRNETPDEFGILKPSDAHETPYPTVNGDYGAFYRALYKALCGEAPPPVDPSEALEVLKILLACKKCSDEKRAVEL
ncbi:MAG: Gfo/Idh/MocA family oxidoreductase [Clostridia bacterium]|nr:Gfo/Idh/MocA family oxidoreductase [Clostridia bacterium]